MQIHKTLFLSSFIGATLCLSCIKEPEVENTVHTDTSHFVKGIFVLNEGLYNRNNASLTYFSLADSTASADFFYLENGRNLGDIGNHMALYGSKMYIVVNISSQVEVMDPNTGKSIKRIPFFDKEVPRYPRYIAFYGPKAYVCSSDSTVSVIDTSTLEIEKIIKAGRNPDGIAVANKKVYVSNSGGLDAPNYDSTVSVIDIATQAEIKKINVGINPYMIVPDKYGDLYVISRGNYGDIKMRLRVIDSQTDEVKKTFTGFEALNLAIYGDTAYVYFFDYGTSVSKIMVLNVKNETIVRENFITDNTQIETVYGITVDGQTGDVFITDAHGFVNTGEVFCFTKNGKKKYSFKAGINPNHLVFLNGSKVDTVRLE